jgi:hypothetical protein
MHELRAWMSVSWPNWPLQLAGTVILVMPLLLQRDQWQSDAFRVQFLCSVLVYVVLFNHQAERQSYVLGATGSVIWFVTGPRKAERGVLLAVALLGTPTLPYFAIWVIMQLELLRPALARLGVSRTVQGVRARAWRREILPLPSVPAADEPFDAVLQAWHMEVDQQPRPISAQLQVREELSLMDRQQLRHRFQLDDHDVIDDEVCPVAELDLHAVVRDREKHLNMDAKPALPELVRKTGFVRALQQPWSDRGMNSYGGIDHLPRSNIDLRDVHG